MNGAANEDAWLEIPEGERVPINHSCSVGRSSSNNLVLSNDKISRKHALVHTQDKSEYWLVDFGSANGTRINGRRISQPTRLRDADEIDIAGITLRFRQAQERPTRRAGKLTAASTSWETRTANCWLLLADIVGSSQLSQNYPDKDLPLVLGKWFLECKKVMDDNEGIINKFLGDGFFAYWPDDANASQKVARAVSQFKEAQKARQPAFRIVVHYGQVSLGGSPSMLEEVLGRAVNFVFRMEKLAAGLKVECLLSSAAKKKLSTAAQPAAAGDHPLPGFDGTFPFFTL